MTTTLTPETTTKRIIVPTIPLTGVVDPAAMIDGYKYGHRNQSPPGTKRVLSNWTPRGTRFSNVHEVIALGLQPYIQWKNEQMDKFFSAPLDYVVKRYARRLTSYLGPDNTVGTEHIAALHKLGYLPLEYRGLPEGTKTPLRVP